MESISTNPNLEPSNPVTAITKNLEKIFGFIGIVESIDYREGAPLDYVNARFAIDNCEFTTVPDGVLPIISINKRVEPKEDDRWAYEISYGMQNGAHSRHVLILKGENPVVEINGRQAGESEVQALANDFERFAQI